MVRRAAAAVLAFLIVSMLPFDAANAKGGRGRIGLPIPIPGLRGETLVKVLEMPRIQELRRPDGQYVDLGYKFNSWSGGDWVGYIGSDSEYLTLNPGDLEAMLALAGHAEPPAVPNRPWGLGELLWIGIGLLVLAFAGLRKLLAPTRRSVEAVQTEVMSSAEAALEAAIKSRSQIPVVTQPRGQPTANQAFSGRAMAPPRAPRAASGGRVGFGRR